jgi:hypothetical protein
LRLASAQSSGSEPPPNRTALAQHSFSRKQSAFSWLHRNAFLVGSPTPSEHPPGFASGKKGKGLLRRFKLRIHAVDSTVMELVANCIGWAKHRRRKAAAKMHLRLDLHSFLPSFAVVDTAAHHDNRRAREVCAGISPG